MHEISPNRFAGIIEPHDALSSGARGIARRVSFNIRSGLNNFPGRKNQTFFTSPAVSLKNRHEVAIMYYGRTSESLRMMSERIVIPTGRYTLGQLLCSLYKRGNRWVDELDDSRLMCTVNGRNAGLFDTIKPGAEICISSRKSIFEA